ncbi:uncharacterized protein LOC123320979 [Coccinella septempunctata]|uniref:uncharacterized protein LOC123320979 n=1 Tax=Coccinella septempunctata TaxID=41139 RepID=UPI001D088404|nr:uncharacterized protein LOC123320979 [Coccinella septempunctata]
MTRTRWKFARIIGIIAASILLYLLLGVKTYLYKASVFLPNAHPNEVWEYVADFSNMKYLNPTIEDFEIIEENGNYNHWQYTVQYKEHLSHWPYLPNYAKARFSIKPDESKSKFFIKSFHTTCLINDFLCLNSESEFSFTRGYSSHGVHCDEEIAYECPAIFARFCEREVKYQRDAIMLNLKRRFQ